MKVIPVVSLKGGVGKSSVTAGFALALRRAGHSVGALDVDFHAPNLPLIFGCTDRPSRGRGDVVVPPVVNGVKLLSWAMLWPEDTAVMVEDVQIDADDLLPIVAMLEQGKLNPVIASIDGHPPVVLERKLYDTAIKRLRQLSEHPGGAVEHVTTLLQPGKVDWGDLDFLVVDTPPESTGIVRAVAETAGVSGVLIVSHASTVSRADVRRTVTLLRNTATPIYGLVINQCGEHDLTEADMSSFARSVGIPIAAVIPHTRDTAPYFDRLVKFVASAEPVVLKPIEVKEDPSILREANRFLKLLEVLRG